MRSLCDRASWDGHLNILDANRLALVRSRRFDERLTRLLLDAPRARFVVEHSPRALIDDKPPDPAFFTIWDVPPGDAPIQILRPKLSFVRSSALSVAGDVLAVVHGAPPTQLTLVDVSTATIRATVSVESGGTGGGLAWSPDGRLAVVEDHSVTLYTPSLTRSFELEVPYACDVAFAPTGSRLAVGLWENGVVTAVPPFDA
jgi:hypothetical protein